MRNLLLSSAFLARNMSYLSKYIDEVECIVLIINYTKVFTTVLGVRNRHDIDFFSANVVSLLNFWVYLKRKLSARARICIATYIFMSSSAGNIATVL